MAREKVKDIIIEQVIKNLLSAHKKIADSGNEKGLICLSRYLLKLAEKFGNVIIEVAAKEIQEKEGYPPNSSS